MNEKDTIRPDGGPEAEASAAGLHAPCGADRTLSGTEPPESAETVIEKRLTCISCPIGCLLEVRHTAGKIVSITGNRCKRGLQYAEKEVFHPERIVTTTVRIEGGTVPLLPVKTAVPVAREKAAEVARAASHIIVTAPIKRGDLVMRDIAGTGADLVATRTVEREDERRAGV